MTAECTPHLIVSSPGNGARHGPILRFGKLGSTMIEARQLAVAGAVHGTFVVATEQDAGRGRAARAWVSPPGNFHATAVLRPGGEVRHAPQLGFVVALAVAEAVDRLAGPGTTLKWPNDVMRGGAKLAGILLERLEDGTVLAGIGLNVAHAPTGLPYPVTSLRLLGCAAALDAVIPAVAEAVQAQWLRWRGRGFADVLERWLAAGPGLGTPLAVRQGAVAMTGRFAGLRDDGALLLDVAGHRHAVVAGDVQPCAAVPDMAKTGAC